MSPGALMLTIVFLAVGCVLGWHSNRARAAHGDVRTTKNRLPGFRKTRLRSGLIAITIVLLLILILSALVRR